MEQSSSRLYAGPLSQAALKILAALRAENQDQHRGNLHSSSSRRQMERCNYTHVESWTPSSCSQSESKDTFSCWPICDHNSTNETQSRQTPANVQASLQKKTPQAFPFHQRFQTQISHRSCPDPPAHLHRQVVSSSQETESSSYQHNTFSFPLQLPNCLSDQQTSPCNRSAGILKPAFMLSQFKDVEGPDETFPSTTEQPDSHSAACHTLLPFSDERKETVNSSSAHNEDEAIWDVGADEAESLELPGTRVKWIESVSNLSEEAAGGVDKHQQSELNTTETKRGHLPPIDFVTKDVGQTVADTAERRLSEGPLVQSEATTFILEDNSAHDLERFGLVAVAVESRTETDYEGNIEHKLLNCFATKDTDSHRINTNVQKLEEVRVLPKSAEGSDGERCLVPTLSMEFEPLGSEFRPLDCPDNQQPHGDLQTKRKSDVVLIPERSQNSSLPQDLITNTTSLDKELYTKQQTSGIHSHHPPSFPQKRRCEVFQHQCVNLSLKSHKKSCPPKWELPHSSPQTVVEGGVGKVKKIRLQPSISGCPTSSEEQQVKITPKTDVRFKIPKQSHVLEQTGPISQSKLEKSSNEMGTIGPKQKLFAKLCKHRLAKLRIDPAIVGLKGFHDVVTTSELQAHSKAGLQPTSLTSDGRIKDSGRLNPEERVEMLQQAGQAEAVVLTMMFQDGATQLDHEQKLAPAVCGLLVLMKNDLCCATPCWSLGPNDSLVYLKLEHNPPWAQQQLQHTQQTFTRDMILCVLSRSKLVVCYKAKDFLRTVLLVYKQDLSWKRVAGCQIQDPQVSGWLLDPSDPSSCFKDLLNKHCKKPRATPSLSPDKASQIISSLYWLFDLHLALCSKLQSHGLWELYSEIELRMITVLAVMESHCIYVDKGALKRTSDLLGTKMKQLEQEAHKAAGEIFLVTSSAQLRTVLFEKLRLQERCENKKLPKTVNKQQQSTSEAALLQLQDLHPLPKIILEYRQVHKIKSTFVDGILSCMKSKNYISSTWHQTSAVTGRISAKHPNFQALPRQPLQISQKQNIQGKEEEVVTIHPRDMFIPREGWSFLAADFCQVELRLLAHFSSDPELLRVFTDPQADVFTLLASQWKVVDVDEVTPEDREHAKRIVYSVVYGAGRERLSGILGVNVEQASRFQDSFLQTYRGVQAFIQRTIQQSHKQGYVVSLMGRRRLLPNVSSPDWGLRMQAERQAVNFVVQGSAADLCKMAMITIFNLVSSSSSLSARLLAQLHDELLYEVEDSQVEKFAALVRSTMESLQHIHHLGVHLKVPLKVAVSVGKSWGSMSELHTAPSVS
ncbi:DNA polymerase nu isoform X1 [Poecilia formosa]|uniref:DNA polymerase nu isoform X1 n=1 Tax=Poecilia formosa TaxID=48698 RepID=UPI0007B7B67D|nr:PREDICTED: DNA polymerase nu isoform X1 [Poecilia formosa]